MAKRSRQESSNTTPQSFLFAEEASDESNVGTQGSLFLEEPEEQPEKPKKTVKRSRKPKSEPKSEQTSTQTQEEQSLVLKVEVAVQPVNDLFESPTSIIENQEPSLSDSNITQDVLSQADFQVDGSAQELLLSTNLLKAESVNAEVEENTSEVEVPSVVVQLGEQLNEENNIVESSEEQASLLPQSDSANPAKEPEIPETNAPDSVISTGKLESTSDPFSIRDAEDKKPSAYQVVARRYRPQAFDELIGQETVARALSNAIETDRVGHAYLFTGARGVGKTSCARIFAKALNCVEGPTTHPCLKCDSCLGVATGEDVDVIEIDGASNRGVDEIRLLRQNATIAPSRSLYKIYIIDEVHMLTREAFNALLKTLEEPPARVKFIFCTTEPNKIPITILSRCQRFDFSGINGNSIANRLAQIATQEGAQAEEGVFEILARRANGSMRDAQSLLEQLLSFAPNYISQADVHNMLGSVDDKKIFDLLKATVDGNIASAFEILAEAADQGVDFGILVEQTLGVYRDLMVVGSGCGAKELMYSPVGRLTDLQQTAQELGMRRILASLQILDQTVQRIRFSTQPRILVELAFARLCRLDSFQAIESLIVQLKQGAVNLSSFELSSNELKKK